MKYGINPGANIGLLCKSTIMKVVETGLQSAYDVLWYSCISNVNSKLRTYCKFKTNFVHENYIHMLHRTQRASFCKLRVSAHILMIEKGRYSIPSIPPEFRLCQVCNLKEVEDEFHFVMRCKLYEQHREDLLSSLSEILNTDNFSDDEYFITIMSANDFDVVKIVARFMTAAYTMRCDRV